MSKRNKNSISCYYLYRLSSLFCFRCVYHVVIWCSYMYNLDGIVAFKKKYRNWMKLNASRHIWHGQLKMLLPSPLPSRHHRCWEPWNFSYTSLFRTQNIVYTIHHHQQPQRWQNNFEKNHMQTFTFRKESLTVFRRERCKYNILYKRILTNMIFEYNANRLKRLNKYCLKYYTKPTAMIRILCMIYVWIVWYRPIQNR